MKPVPLVATVIPYFQRTPGLLSACVASILSQSGGHRSHVVIADDESPIAAEDELAAEVRLDPRVTIIRQKNAGPGAARNTALDHVPADTAFVALLDSDDTWRDGFLACAVPVLERGYDIFFADSRRFSQKESRFRWNANPALNLTVEGHQCLDAERQVFAFEGNFFDLILRRSSLLGSSTMIYRLDTYPELRFSRRLFNGQDRLFKLHLSQRVRKAAFTTQEFGIEGEGVNIFDSAAWGSRKSLNLLSSYIQLPKTILDEVELRPAQRLFVKAQLSQSRHSFVASMVHLLARGEKLPIELVLKTFKADPASLALLLPNLVRVLGRKLSGAGADAVPPNA